MLGRLTATVLTVVALAVGAEHLLLPGVAPELARSLEGSRAQLGIFALSVTPIVSAYVWVEIAAFFVPRWSRLRHGPSGRRRLELAARLLAVVLLVGQANGVALFLQSYAEETGDELSISISLPIAITSLVGGVCVQWLCAQWISSRGLINGLVALTVAHHGVKLLDSVLRLLRVDWPERDPALPRAPVPHGLDSRGLAFTLFAAILVVAATWIALRKPSEAETTETDPWVPVPAGSFQAYWASLALLSLPAALQRVGLQVPELLTLPRPELVDATVELAMAACATWLYASLMHRPSELGPLLERTATQGALRAAGWPTLAFLATVVATQRISLIDLTGLIVLMPAVMDVAHSVRVGLQHPQLVPVWEERRVAAVPLLRAALARAGIATETRGFHVVRFWQLFVPYAPVQLLATPADAERARATLEHLVAGDASAVHLPAADDDSRPRPNPALQPVTGLAVCLAASLGLYTLWYSPTFSPAPDVAESIHVEAVRVDDTIDVFGIFGNSPRAREAGIEVHSETIVGDQSVATRYAQIAVTATETKADALERLRAWLDELMLPPGARFGFEHLTDDAGLSAIRTYVLVGESAFRAADVVGAVVMDTNGPRPDAFVAVTLSEPARKRFAELTAEWTRRRVALVVDGYVISAPLVMTSIEGGKLQLPTTPGDHATKLAQAQRWAAGLQPR